MRDLADRLQRLVAETRRRGVFKVVAAYAVVAWGASLGASELLPAFGAPDWAVRAFVICTVVLGVPMVAALAWIYEISGGSIVRDRGLDRDAASGDGKPAGEATLLFGATDSIRVRWHDADGTHERVFFKTFRIGRDAACDLQLGDPLISRRHAEVRFDQGRWWITDLQSRNGVRLDGQLVERATLPPVCSVQLYDAAPALTLEIGGPSSAATMVPRTGVEPVHPRG